MPHQMKGIGNGRKYVYLLIPNTWKSIREMDKEVGEIFHTCHVSKIICHIFLLISC
jgi:hypothetical protein